MSSLNLVDQFGRPLSASYGRFYDGATRSGDRTWIPYTATDSSVTDTTWDRMEMLSIARYLYANVGFIRGAIDDLALYSVGSGITIRSACKDPELRKVFNEAWDLFSKNCDYTGRVPQLNVMLRAMCRAMDVDGDIGAIPVLDANGDPKIQTIKGHRILDCGGNDSKDGVIVDGDRILGYRVKITGKDGKDSYVEYPASRFRLLFEARTTDPFRGITSLCHAINNSRDSLDILKFEKLAVKENSSIGLTITTTDGKDAQGGFFSPVKTEYGPDGKPVTKEQLRGGAIPRLGLNEKIESYQSNRPSTTFTGFLDYVDSDIAIGLNVPVEFIRISRSGLGGAPQRFCLAKAQRKFDSRGELLADWVQAIRFFVIGQKIFTKKLPLCDDWWKVTIHYPSKISVDIGRDAAQNRQDIDAGIRTITEDASERSVDFDTLRDTLEAEVDDHMTRALRLHQKHPEFNLDTCLMLMRKPTANGNLPGTGVPTPEPPPQP
ncbi:MAG: Bacteriophage capsid protein-like protein [Verrucomicrobiales bacterium]|nr:Bacteriophage capsid protein-like protein [Verrucomicrobiales bacterium]